MVKARRTRVANPCGSKGWTREVAVDLMVAAGALDAARRISDAGDDAVVIVVSHDGDFHDLHRYSSSVPILVAGCFRDSERQQIKQGVAGAR